MKRFLALVISVFLSGLSCAAQTPSWLWASSATSFGGGMEVKGMGSDAAGNTYTSGYVYERIQFGSLPRLHGTMFLVKHDPQGKPVWSYGADCMPYGFASDSVGNSYVTGFFMDTLTLGNNTLICQGKKDIFVAKFDSAGNVVWANRAGGIGNHPLMPPMPPIIEDEGYSLGIDVAGNCYVGGMVIASDTAAAMFDTISVFPPVSTLRPTHFNVLAKYNTAGQIQWVKTINSSQWLSKVMAVSKHGQCFMSGMFNNTINYNGTSLASQGDSDICLASFDSSGNLSWVKSFGGSDMDYGDAIAVDKRGNVFLTGAFSTSANFGSFTLVKSGSPSALFVAKLDNAGNVLWASQATGLGSSGDSKITLDAAGNSYVCAGFSGTVVIGSQTFTSSGATTDVLVSKWDTTGNPVWAIAAQGGGYDYPQGIALDPATSACYVAGTYEYNLNFGNIGLQTGQNTNFFMAKLRNTVSGMPESAERSNFTVFPNPAQQRFSVQFKNAVVGRKGTFQLYSITGKLVREMEFVNSSQIVVERNELPAGLYLYRIQTGNNKVETGKIVLN